MLRNIPTLAIVVAAYNILAFVYVEGLTKILFSLTLPSGDSMPLQTGALLLAVAAILLFIEIVKATRTGSASIIDHILSMLLFVICLVEFLLVKGLGTPVFFLIMLICLLDVIAGFTVTITAARRDFTMGGGGGVMGG